MPLPAFLAALGPIAGALGKGGAALGKGAASAGKFAAAHPNLSKGVLGGLMGGVGATTGDDQSQQLALMKAMQLGQMDNEQFGQMFLGQGINPGSNV